MANPIISGRAGQDDWSYACKCSHLAKAFFVGLDKEKRRKDEGSLDIC